MIDYATHIGNRVLFTLAYRDGTPPFGAAARLDLPAQGKGSSTSGIVAEKGQLYLSGVPAQGTITLSWREDGAAKTCQAPFRLPNTPSASPVKLVSAVCR